jgi:hypothetical protein
VNSRQKCRLSVCVCVCVFALEVEMARFAGGGGSEQLRVGNMRSNVLRARQTDFR